MARLRAGTARGGRAPVVEARRRGVSGGIDALAPRSCGLKSPGRDSGSRNRPRREAMGAGMPTGDADDAGRVRRRRSRKGSARGGGGGGGEGDAGASERGAGAEGPRAHLRPRGQLRHGLHERHAVLLVLLEDLQDRPAARHGPPPAPAPAPPAAPPSPLSPLLLLLPPSLSLLCSPSSPSPLRLPLSRSLSLPPLPPPPPAPRVRELAQRPEARQRHVTHDA